MFWSVMKKKYISVFYEIFDFNYSNLFSSWKLFEDKYFGKNVEPRGWKDECSMNNCWYKGINLAKKNSDRIQKKIAYLDIIYFGDKNRGQ
jgi:hypothetical protein